MEKVKYGWFSQKSKSLGNNTYIYEDYYSKKKVEVSIVNNNQEDSGTKFEDIKLVGRVGKHIKKIENNIFMNYL